jgi:hypothetical protein
MSVWLTIPSARPVPEAEACLSKWRDQGYRLAIFRDAGAPAVECDLLIRQPYPGYAKAVNALVTAVLEIDPSCEWTVAAGDDTSPDMNFRADEIAVQCTEHFGGTFGVMQPTGDPWADAHGRMIERIAGSPWIGRDFAERINRGKGPYWESYQHCFLDNEMMDVAKKYGAFWQRPDLIHRHNHWMRSKAQMPGFLAEANSSEHWQKYSRIYFERKAQGFPGSEPIAA